MKKLYYHLLSVIALLFAITSEANELRIFSELVDDSHGSVFTAGELDFLKDGTLGWNGTTLTLSNAVLEGSVNDLYPLIYFSDASAVTIKLFGNNVIRDNSQKSLCGLEIKGQTTIVCENENVHEMGFVASLEINSNSQGIRLVKDDAHLILDRVNVTVNAPASLGVENPAGSGNTKLEVKNDTKLDIRCEASSSAIRTAGLNVILGNKEAIAEPAGAKLENGMVQQDGKDVKGHLVIDRLEWETTEVLLTTKARINNINASALEKWYPEIIKSGKVSWDNDKKILTLDNATIAPDYNDYGISVSGGANLSIVLKGKNSINTQRQGITSVKGAKITIMGDGSLDINATNHYGIDVAAEASVTINNTNLHLSGSGYGIYGRDSNSSILDIFQSEVIVEPADKGVITGFKEAKIRECMILEPEGAVMAAGSVYDKNGDIYTGRLVIGQEKADALELVKSDVNLLENENVRIYNALGQDFTSMKHNLPQGNYILRVGNQVQKISVR